MVKNAIENINKAINLDPKNSLNYAIKTQILQFKGIYKEALKTIKKAIEMDPNVANYYSDLAYILIWMNKFEKAIKAINKAIEIEPTVAEYYSQLASVYCFLNQYEKALETLSIAIKIDPKMTQFRLQKARYLAYYMKKYKDALRVIEEVINPNLEKFSLFELYKEQAGILLSMKNNEAALSVIKKAKQIYPHKEIYPNIY